jgi:formylglycine-generating enzyme required for sulfatase activity
MVLIPGGTFEMGSADGPIYERPVHGVKLHSFWMDKKEVTVAQFRQFVNAAGYVTDAEKFGWSGVFDLGKKAWGRVDGANWRQPEGPGRSLAGEQEPVMQVSWNDAVSFAAWAGKRLPTEAEWEYAARGGLAGKKYAWGDELMPEGKYMANYWQGSFLERDEGKDGFAGVAPVGRFPANGYGLYDMTGNVWEWCADSYSDFYYANSAKENPTGPPAGFEQVIRGGSWMCARNFCTNYRVAGRSHATADSGLNNLGFRCARDAKGE